MLIACAKGSCTNTNMNQHEGETLVGQLVDAMIGWLLVIVMFRSYMFLLLYVDYCWVTLVVADLA